MSWLILYYVLLLSAFVVLVLYSAPRVEYYIHMLQLNSYRNDRFLRWINTDRHNIYNYKSALVLAPLLLLYNQWLFVVSSIAVYMYLLFVRTARKEKKKFVYTSRVKRLFVVIVVFFVLLFLLAFALSGDQYLRISILSIGVSIVIFPYILVALNGLMIPIEHMVSIRYVADARGMLEEMAGVTVIGITGSYGKTSTKYILNEILSSVSNTVMTPKSYNTLMGVTITIRSSLKTIHDYFIVEMGAKQRGDIKEICDLVRPTIGVLTTIGQQHLETFGTKDNIKKTKLELPASIPDSGVIFLNADDKNQQDVDLVTGARRVTYGVSNTLCDYRAHDIEIDHQGRTSFVIAMPNDDYIELQTSLLGMHNVYNILCAVSVAIELGVPKDNIYRSVTTLKQIPHRLSMSKTNEGVMIIDDSFNSNPIGADNALKVLAAMPGKSKIIVTPGMVELGGEEYDKNRELGVQISGYVNRVVLVGDTSQTRAIKDGLESARYTNDLYVAYDLKEASSYCNRVVRSGDVVLFENDLPDNYVGGII